MAVKAQFEFSLLDQAGEPVSSHTRTSDVRSFATTQPTWGYMTFMKREALVRSKHLKDDCFTFRCDITVMTEIRTEETKAATALVHVPPSNLHQHLGDLLLSKKGADVTFKVGRQTFFAHRCVLAARSPVFEAELFGQMKETTTTDCIRIVDMKPLVFSALLHFIYNDSLLETNDQEAVMTQHLFVAADKYNMERLKLICLDKLCKHIDASTAATTLVLAEQHHCHVLKEACFEFLNSPANLNVVMATDGFKHLTASCPSLLAELLAKEKGSFAFRVEENLKTCSVKPKGVPSKSSLRMVRTKTRTVQRRKSNRLRLGH